MKSPLLFEALILLLHHGITQSFTTGPPLQSRLISQAKMNRRFELNAENNLNPIGEGEMEEEEEESVSSFSSLGLSPEIQSAIRTQGWDIPTPIQTLAIPAILNLPQSDTKSIWSEAPTGSGKTGAFAIPLIQMLTRARRDRVMNIENDKEKDGKVSCLILSPTRELCYQIALVFEEMLASLPKGRTIDVVTITGGVPLEPQIQDLTDRRGKENYQLDVMIATPGRLVDVLRASEKRDSAEAALETRLMKALDVTGKTDASLSLEDIMGQDLDRDNDDGRSQILDMLDQVDYLVVDEADRLLGQAFKSDVDEVLKLLPRVHTRQSDAATDASKTSTVKTMLFSATFPEQIQPRVEKVLQRLGGYDIAPLRLSCSELDNIQQEVKLSNRQKRSPMRMPAAALTNSIELQNILIEEKHRTMALRQLIKTHTGSDAAQPWDRILVFVSTRYLTEHISRKLRKAGIISSELHGKLDQNARIRRLEDFKKGKIKVLVATDLASRGLDVKGLPAVVNFDLPRSTADFTHRIGRTGRAGNKGVAVSFITPQNEAHFDLIETRHFGGIMANPRVPLEGLEPDKFEWVAKAAVSRTSVEGTAHSTRGLAFDRMHGGVKGRRQSKKDKLREAQARAKSS